MSLKVLSAPDKVLTQKSIDVKEDEFGDGLNSFVNQMIITMKENNGIGLAAIQVGLKRRIIVASIDGKDVALINPKIVSFSDDKSTMEEGCLSVPTILAEITRPESIVVSYIDRDYNQVEERFSGLASHIIQHEIDHLNGKTILSGLSRLKRDIYRRKVKKIKAN